MRNSDNSATLVWWRTLKADELELCDVTKLRQCMQGFQILREPGWSDAVRGDAAAAIGIAVRVALMQPCIEPVLDLVMSAVLGPAVEGNGAAQHFLAYMVRRHAAADPVAESIALSWIAASRAAAQARRSFQPQVRMRPPHRRRVSSCGGSARGR